ncbi:hypothetical protein ACHAW6_006278 [Cyclotella cf. meneghiniana]
MSHNQSMLKHTTDINRGIPPKPKWPLTIFNLFCILERNYIVQQNQKRSAILSNASTDINTDPYVATRPERYRDVVLPSNWYVVGMNRVKRSKHKVHGVISFNELTKQTSNRWNSVDAETKKYCETIAVDELQRYRRDMAEYEAIYRKDAVEAQKRTPSRQLTTNGVAQSNDLVRSDGIPKSSSKNSQLRPMEGGSAVKMGMTHITSQATPQKRWYMYSPFQAKIEKSTVESVNSDNWTSLNRTRGHSPTLSDYLPDDQEAALALVGNNYDNILHGEELEKAFDSD